MTIFENNNFNQFASSNIFVNLAKAELELAVAKNGLFIQDYIAET